VCDNRSVGIVITDAAGRHLVFDRATYPPGAAACAGHVDGHASDEDAARAEVREESGLTVDSLAVITTGWRANACRRAPGSRGVGHQWTVFATLAHGELSPSPRETANIRWAAPAEMHELYLRTLDLATGAITAEQFEQQPGLSPVWALWFHRAGALRAEPAQLALLETLYTRPPR
jgi:8-oxo-dGTP pyrophosphatase MutT (NUDIX family)